ncbi:hypothetical protein KR044_012975 [Drosophila immigrans]|nr:hypothetical protein KR044_012975 [Drosophila immigrans]
MHLNGVILLLLMPLILADEELPDRHLVQARIFNGKTISLSALGGYAVQIYHEEVFVCTGTLLSKNHILTAAHCFENANFTDFYVVAGETEQVNYLLPEERNYVIKGMQHPDYNKFAFKADIAVLKVETPIRGRGTGYLNLCSKLMSAGKMVTVSGWGSSEMKKDNNKLRMMRIPVVPKKECMEKLGKRLPVNVICATNYAKSTICSGDSGGPMVFDGEVCGVSTWTFACGNNAKPDIFMSVYVYRDFIKRAMDELGD